MSDNKPNVNPKIIINTIEKILAYGLDRGFERLRLEKINSGELSVAYQAEGQVTDSLLLSPLCAQPVIDYFKQTADWSSKEQGGLLMSDFKAFNGLIKLSLINTADGELLDMQFNLKTVPLFFLDELSLQGSQLKLLSENILKTGLSIISSPIEAGKTTTGLACLLAAQADHFNTYCLSSKNLPTIDGVHYTRLKRRPQDWNKALSAIARQDPDLILLDEPPADFDAAPLARLSSGCGVFVGLKATDSYSALQQLHHAGLQNAAAEPVFNLLLNQKLTKRLCPLCRQTYQIDQRIFQTLNTDFADLDQDLIGLNLFQAAGCANCQHCGYAGSIGLFELIKIDRSLNTVIHRNKNKSTVIAALLDRCELTLPEDGFIKALQGLTTIEAIKTVL